MSATHYIPTPTEFMARVEKLMPGESLLLTPEAIELAQLAPLSQARVKHLTERYYTLALLLCLADRFQRAPAEGSDSLEPDAPSLLNSEALDLVQLTACLPGRLNQLTAEVGALAQLLCLVDLQQLVTAATREGEAK